MSDTLTIAITGANSGIGLRAARRLARRGHRVLALCRDVERAHAALDTTEGSIEIIEADLSLASSIARAAEEVAQRGPLDTLINNAAVFDQNQRTVAFTPEGHELFWATNHLGPFELTARLSESLSRSRRPHVVFVASKGLITMPRIRIRFDELDSAAWYTPTRAYYHAKLAQVMTAVTLAERVRGAVVVRCIRVPAVRLDAERLAAQPALLRLAYAPKNAAAADPETLAAAYERAVTGQTRSDNVYIDEFDRTVALPRFATGLGNRQRLWSVSQTATGETRWAW